jgi:hypothetical protein
MGPSLSADAAPVASLRVGASVDGLVRRQMEERSFAAKLAMGILATGAVALLAQLGGVDMRAGFGVGQPDLVHQLIRGFLSRPTALV